MTPRQLGIFRDGGSLHLFSFLCHDIGREEGRVCFAPFDGAPDGRGLSPSLQLAKQFHFPCKVHRRKIRNCCSKKVDKTERKNYRFQGRKIASDMQVASLRVSASIHASHLSRKRVRFTHGCQVGIFNAIFGKKWPFSEFVY